MWLRPGEGQQVVHVSGRPEKCLVGKHDEVVLSPELVVLVPGRHDDNGSPSRALLAGIDTGADPVNQIVSHCPHASSVGRAETPLE